MSGMEQRVSCIALSVADAKRAQRFYEDMGWRMSSASREIMPLFNANGFVFILFDRQRSAHEAFGGAIPPEAQACVDNPPAFEGITFSYVVREHEDVQAIIDHAVKSGGRMLSAAKEQPWGNVSGYFADPDGHIWEVSRTGRTPLQPDGNFRIGD
jgi:Uncharacterized protein conserved in bacteria